MAIQLRKKKILYPTKATVNLVMRERSVNSPRIALPIFLLIVAVIGVFTKFAVIDRLAEVGAARTSLAAAETALQQAQAVNTDYDVVLEEYERYSSNGLTEEEKAAVDRTEVLDLLETELLTSAQVSVISVMDNTMTLTVSGVTLQELSALMQQLKDHRLVTGVAVFSAGTASGQAGNAVLTGVTMTVSLEKPETGGDAS